MPAKTVNLIVDTPAIQRHIEKRVTAQAKVSQPISAIEAGFKLCQDGRFIVNFDTREKHERDGEWTNALDGPSLTLPHWRAAYESAGEQGIWFVLLSGEAKHIKPGENRDAAVAGEFGKALLAIVQDAKARGVFDQLPLRPDCQVEVLEFDFMWNWPTNDSAVGRANLYRKLDAVRLPR